MKSIIYIASVLLLLICFFVPVNAVSGIENIFEALPENAENILSQFGVSQNLSEDFAEITPEKALKTVFGIFKGELKEPMKTTGISIAVLFIASIFCSFIEKDGSSLGLLGKGIALMCVMFSVITAFAKAFSECSSALLITKDFMLILIPILAGIISFSGNPSLAISFNTVTFGFAEVIAVFFENIFPVLCIVLTCISSAVAINPSFKLDSIGKIMSKAVSIVMAFISGIFVAVLSIRGVIAGAADTVTIRGVRFLVGNAVPIVGSAIGDALNSVSAGFGLIKHSFAMVGVVGIIAVNLPILIKLIIWKLMLLFVGIVAEIIAFPEIKTFCENINGVLSVALAALCFTSFIFIISTAIILTISKGA